LDNLINVLLVGVGGQGIVLAGDLLAQAALLDGLDVKKSEIHGMAQRGGSVTSHVRFGSQVFSPVISEGQVDLLLAFERLEALRYASYLRPGGTALVNDQVIFPATVLSGDAGYPSGVEEAFAERRLRAYVIDGPSLAEKAGHPLTVNVALLGVVSRHLPISDKAWEGAMSKHIKPAFLDVNRQAFQLGRTAISWK
jgi:indolepyruvate ferredoxin oxidoreductase, beta subunit